MKEHRQNNTSSHNNDYQEHLWSLLDTVCGEPFFTNTDISSNRNSNNNNRMSKWGASLRKGRSKPWSLDKKETTDVAKVLTALSFEDAQEADKFVDITDHTQESTEATFHDAVEGEDGQNTRNTERDDSHESSPQKTEDASAITEATTTASSEAPPPPPPLQQSPVAAAKQQLLERSTDSLQPTTTVDVPSLQVPVKQTAEEIEAGSLQKAPLKRDSSVDVPIEEGSVSNRVETVETTGKQSMAKNVALMAAAEANRRKAQELRQSNKSNSTMDDETAVNETTQRNVTVETKVLLSGGFDDTTEPTEQQEQEDAHSTRAEAEFETTAAGQTTPTKIPIQTVTAGSPVVSEVTYEKTSQKHDNSSLGSYTSGGSGSPSPRKKVSEIIRRDLWDKDPMVVTTAMQILAVKASQNLSIRSAIARSGGLLAIVRAMESHQECVDLQMAACLALEKLALDTENELAIGEVGGVEAILATMMAHFHNDKLQEAAWSALWNCTCGNACDTMTIDTEGGMKAIVLCMKEHVASPTIQASACGTLSNLCLNNDERLTSLAEAGGFVAISAAMETHWENDKVRSEAAHTLYSLVAHTAQRHLESQMEDEEIIEEIIEEEDEEVVS